MLTTRTLLAVAALAATLIVPLPAAQGAPGAATCTSEQGQALIDVGRLERAIQTFTCVVKAQPTEVEGYRGRAEARLLLGRYSDAMADYGRVTAVVEPVHPGAVGRILAGYDARLAADPDSVPALTGASFARWFDFQYPQAIQVLDHLLEVRPDDPYATLFRGSSRVLKGVTKDRGPAELERAIELAPTSPDVRWVVADAYTYGLPRPERAFSEATLALQWGLDTPRVRAILGAALNAFGETEAAAGHIATHIEQVTTELVTTAQLDPGTTLALELVPGRTYAIPLPVAAGGTISVSTSSKDFWDSIAVLLAPDGSPVVGSDDEDGYFAAFDRSVETGGTYVLRVTSFEALGSGTLLVKRL
jgi:hypothetical protein